TSQLLALDVCLCDASA
ncbi:DUF645 family protein, partial [Vibrio cholerae]|nr:DUF645 family protein [Vibrio cholerae]